MNYSTSLLSASALLACTCLTQQALAQAPTMPDQQAQLASDVRSVPAGMGAIIVPVLTKSVAEPRVLVMLGNKRIASGRTGERIIVPPGRYEVLVGHGPIAQWTRRSVTVGIDKTMMLKPFVGAVRVNLVDQRGRPLSGSYVIRSLDSSAQYGPVSMSADEAASKVASWLLPAGRYKITLGEDSEADANSLSFSVHAGEVLRYRLVVDAGDLLRSDLADEDFVYEPSIWRFRWEVGGSASLDARNDQLTTPARQYLLVNLFSRMQAGVDVDNHLGLLTFNVDQSLIGLDSELGADIPLSSLSNQAELELLYTYRAARVIGPYVRAIGRTSFAESHFFPETDVDIDTRSEDGALEAQTEAPRGGRIRLFKAMSPVVLQQGVGPSITVVDNDVVDFGFRGGVSARQAFYRDGRFFEGRSGDTLSLVRVEDRIEFGGEATATAGLRISKAISISTKFDSFLPYKLFTGDQELFPFRWDSTASLRLGRFASASYNFSMRRDEVVVDKLQLTHGLVVAMQASLF